MNKKIKTILSLATVSIMTASAILPVNALSKPTYKKCMTTTTSCLYIVINGVKYELPLKPLCPNKPTKPGVTPEVKPDTKPENPDNNNNSGSDSKPDTKPENPGNNNNSGSDSKPDTKPENPGNNNNSGSDSKPDTKPENPDDNNNSGSTNENFSAYQREVLNLVNAERAKVGLNALKLDSSLTNVATIKSKDMIDKNYFSHNSPTYGSPFDMMKKFGISYKAAGENIAYGQRSPKEVMNSWMNSQGHRENILNPNFTHLGVGVAKNVQGTIYWTQMFIGK